MIRSDRIRYDNIRWYSGCEIVWSNMTTFMVLQDMMEYNVIHFNYLLCNCVYYDYFHAYSDTLST